MHVAEDRRRGSCLPGQVVNGAARLRCQHWQAGVGLAIIFYYYHFVADAFLVAESLTGRVEPRLGVGHLKEYSTNGRIYR